MEEFVYFVHYRVKGDIPIWSLWPIYTHGSTVLTVNFPVRDRDDLALFQIELAKQLVLDEGDPIDPRDILIKQLILQHEGYTQGYNKWKVKKERAREDAERGHSYWWRKKPPDNGAEFEKVRWATGCPQDLTY